jgi:DNA-binding CsgD family transcriptional regulator
MPRHADGGKASGKGRVPASPQEGDLASTDPGANLSRALLWRRAGHAPTGVPTSAGAHLQQCLCGRIFGPAATSRVTQVGRRRSLASSWASRAAPPGGSGCTADDLDEDRRCSGLADRIPGIHSSASRRPAGGSHGSSRRPNSAGGAPPGYEVFSSGGATPPPHQWPATADSSLWVTPPARRSGPARTSKSSRPRCASTTWCGPPPNRECRPGMEPPFTRRMIDIAFHLIDGATDREIARALGVSERTVSSDVREMSNRIGARSRAQAIALISGI